MNGFYIGVETAQFGIGFRNQSQRTFASLLRVYQLLLDRVTSRSQRFANLSPEDVDHDADKNEEIEKLPGLESWIVHPRG
jgi:hypothetical protein